MMIDIEFIATLHLRMNVWSAYLDIIVCIDGLSNNIGRIYVTACVLLLFICLCVRACGAPTTHNYYLFARSVSRYAINVRTTWWFIGQISTRLLFLSDGCRWRRCHCFVGDEERKKRGVWMGISWTVRHLALRSIWDGCDRCGYLFGQSLAVLLCRAL